MKTTKKEKTVPVVSQTGKQRKNPPTNLKKSKMIDGNYAAIDIGSNAIRLLIKHIDEKAENKFSKVLMLRIPLRLGFDVFGSGKISEEKGKKTIHLMKACRLLMKLYEVSDYRACATSAMRDAKNGDKLIEKIKKTTGIRIEIINGQEEAGIIYNTRPEHNEDRNGNYMYVDVGGGSTEINFLTNGKLLRSKSYDIGTIRMLNDAVKESAWEELRHDLEEMAVSHPRIEIIGSGGNINKLYRLAKKKDRRKLSMPVEELEKIHLQLKSMSLHERMDRFELKPDRADVIVPAGEIFLTIARIIQARHIYVPVIGLADGIIDGLYRKNKV